MKKQKGFIKILLVIIAIIAIALFFYILMGYRTEVIPNDITDNTTSSSLQNSEKDVTADWKIYRNDKYGFEFKYPSVWVLRDGSKDYKTTGLDNFYQFCDKTVVTPDKPLGSNDNFVGRCENEFFKINIWKLTSEIKMIMNDFSTLKLEKDNQITIGGRPASEFVYSGHSEILEGVHTWHLFVTKTNNYIYSINGDSCRDNKIECSQILSTFKFTK